MRTLFIAFLAVAVMGVGIARAQEAAKTTTGETGKVEMKADEATKAVETKAEEVKKEMKAEEVKKEMKAEKKHAKKQTKKAEKKMEQAEKKMEQAEKAMESAPPAPPAQ